MSLSRKRRELLAALLKEEGIDASLAQRITRSENAGSAPIPSSLWPMQCLTRS